MVAPRAVACVLGVVLQACVGRSWADPAGDLAADSAVATVFKEGSNYSVRRGVVDEVNGFAFGSWSTSEGWDILDISAGRLAMETDSRSAMFALGFLESYFTCKRISIFYDNYKADLFDTAKSTPSKKAIQFIKDNHDWLREKVQKESVGFGSEYWQEVGAVLAQFDGMLEGHRKSCPSSKPLEVVDLLLLNMLGDLYDVMPGLERDEVASSPRKFFRRSGLPFAEPGARPTRCSAAVRLEGNLGDQIFTDITVGHTTWDIFTNAFPRVFKQVSIPRSNGRVYTEAFSSSPGLLSSMDDFYATSGTSSLFVLETSLNVMDPTKYKALSHKTAPCWIRVIAANRIATGGAEWSDLFSKDHSGTYNNQWMIVDRSRFQPGLPVADVVGLLWVLEEAPSVIVSKDMTRKLAGDGYWASYNVPFFEEISEALGYQGSALDDLSYTRAPRAKQFKKLIPKAASGLEGMHWLIRWNDWHCDLPGDPDLSSPAKAIAARGDLLPVSAKQPDEATALKLGGGRSSWGALDSKVASWSAWERSTGPAALIQLGPTTQNQPPFCWLSEFTDPHEGHPECFDFGKVPVGLSQWMDRNTSQRRPHGGSLAQQPLLELASATAHAKQTGSGKDAA